MTTKAKQKAEFGDFQTPKALALGAARVLKGIGVKPASVIEPTCGRGAFVFAAAETFPTARRIVGVDINKEYLGNLEALRQARCPDVPIHTIHADYFTADWEGILEGLPGELLILGNPPWVTNAELGRLESENLPEKSNFQRRRGLDALTGKSNFDISEWMLVQQLGWLSKRGGALAVLVKHAVARKVLAQAWKQNAPIADARIYEIDAMKHFGAAVSACLFYLSLDRGNTSSTKECAVYSSLSATSPSRHLGYKHDLLLSDLEAFDELEDLFGQDSVYRWRSGIKHDCSKVMELVKSGSKYMNGSGERVDLEPDYLYPLMKSSDVARGECRRDRYVLVTQQHIGEDTAGIAQSAPKTWRYLKQNHDLLARRKSSIYRNRPNYSVFGVGDYSFTPWKVAISGFYNHTTFSAIAPELGRPVMVDDTVYFLPCYSGAEAKLLVDLLNSPAAQAFLNAMIFWGDKRPITIELLKRLSLRALADREKKSAPYEDMKKGRPEILKGQTIEQPLFELTELAR